MPTNPDTNPLLTTLRIVRDIAEHAYSTAELCEKHGASDRQMKRYIAEARHLGANLQSTRVEGRYVWSCPNYADLTNLKKWIDLEERRSLIGSPLFDT